MTTRGPLVVLTLALVAACAQAGGPTTTEGPTTTVPPGDGAVVAEFRTPDGVSYRILLTGSAAARAFEAHDQGESPGIPVGKIQPGDGGVNVGHDWHVIEVEFADMAMEVCDGNAGYIDELGHDEFVSQHGEYFCPWGAELVSLTEP